MAPVDHSIRARAAAQDKTRLVDAGFVPLAMAFLVMRLTEASRGRSLLLLAIRGLTAAFLGAAGGLLGVGRLLGGDLLLGGVVGADLLGGRPPGGKAGCERRLLLERRLGRRSRGLVLAVSVVVSIAVL